MSINYFESWGLAFKVSDVALYDHPISAERVEMHARASGLFVEPE